MTLELSIVADVFRHEAQAKHALEALRQAGFDYDQIGIAMRGHEGIDLQSDLESLGVSHKQASYYAQEVKAGHTVVSVRPDGREQEAHEIMRQSGAFTETGEASSQPSDIDKQKAAWDQAVASHQAYLAAQLAANKQEDFHRPRSLKPRLLVITQETQTEEAPLVAEQKPTDTTIVQQEDVTEQRLSANPVTQEKDVTEQKPIIAPAVQDGEVIQQQPSVAPVVQNDASPEQVPLAEEEYHETVAIDDEETLRRMRNNEQASAEVFPPQTQLEQPENRNLLMRNGMLLGGLVLGLGVGVLVALLQREQIRTFVLSMTRTMKTLRKTIARRNRNS